MVVGCLTTRQMVYLQQMYTKQPKHANSCY